MRLCEMNEKWFVWGDKEDNLEAKCDCEGLFCEYLRVSGWINGSNKSCQRRKSEKGFKERIKREIC